MPSPDPAFAGPSETRTEVKDEAGTKAAAEKLITVCIHESLSPYTNASM